MNTEGTRAFLGDLLLCLFFAAAAAAAATDTMCAEGLAGVAGGAGVGAGAGLAHRAMPCNRKSIGNAKALRCATRFQNNVGRATRNSSLTTNEEPFSSSTDCSSRRNTHTGR
jgi:hypothetical protein